MMNKRLLALLAFLNASEAHANQAVDDLVNQSGVLRTNIDIAIQGISGFLVYSPSGYIAPDGVLQSGYITFENMEAYNTALANVQNTTFYSAEDFINDNQQQAQENMEQAVSDFVEATLAIVTVIEVNDQAENAQETGEIADQEALQDFIQDNDVYITEQEVADYNDAITRIEEYGNQYASFTAVLSNDDYMSQFQDTANQYDNSFLDALVAFDASVGVMTVAWDSVSIAVDMSQYYKSADEYYTAGREGEFYTTSPIACGYDFSRCNTDE
jgi:hypothetical protein